jgi:hypothetical protein
LAYLDAGPVVVNEAAVPFGLASVNAADLQCMRDEVARLLSAWALY